MITARERRSKQVFARTVRQARRPPLARRSSRPPNACSRCGPVSKPCARGGRGRASQTTRRLRAARGVLSTRAGGDEPGSRPRWRSTGFSAWPAGSAAAIGPAGGQHRLAGRSGHACDPARPAGARAGADDHRGRDPADRRHRRSRHRAAPALVPNLVYLRADGPDRVARSVTRPPAPRAARPSRCSTAAREPSATALLALARMPPRHRRPCCRPRRAGGMHTGEVPGPAAGRSGAGPARPAHRAGARPAGAGRRPGAGHVGRAALESAELWLRCRLLGAVRRPGASLPERRRGGPAQANGRGRRCWRWLRSASRWRESGRG